MHRPKEPEHLKHLKGILLINSQLHTTCANERKANLQLLCQKQANGAGKPSFLPDRQLSIAHRKIASARHNIIDHCKLPISDKLHDPLCVCCAQMSFALIYQLVMSLFSCTQSRISQRLYMLPVVLRSINTFLPLLNGSLLSN